MKKSLLTLCLAGLLFSAFTIANDPKPKTFTLTEAEVSELFQAIDVANQAMPTSQAPAVQVSQARAVFDKVVKTFQSQYATQAKADSVANAVKPKK